VRQQQALIGLGEIPSYHRRIVQPMCEEVCAILDRSVAP
jgi:hypothetical protein